MRSHLTLLVPIVGWVVACGDTSTPSNASSGGATMMQGGSTSAGAPSAGTGGGGAGGAAGSTSGAGGAAAGSSGAAGAGASGGKAGAGGTSGTAGTSGAAGLSGTAGTGGNLGGAGGVPMAGSAGTSGGASGGSGNTTGCTRELLSTTTDAYFTALALHDPSALPLATAVKFTENGETVALGEEGLWQTAGALKYKHSALDTETCSAMSQAVVPDGSMDIPLALRLKLVNQEITEIETIAVRPGDYSAGASNTAALIASGNTVNWDDPVPAGQENSREEIIAWMNKYFRMFPTGVCNTTSACRRIENGGGSFNCTAGASCSAGQPGPGDNALTPRLILADVATGLGVGFTMFQGNTDMHMFKMFGDQVHGVSAILGAAGSSGWP